MPMTSKQVFTCITCGNTYQRKHHLARHEAAREPQCRGIMTIEDD